MHPHLALLLSGRAAATAFTPLSLSPALWLSPAGPFYSDLGTTVVTADGSAVRRWADLSGNARHADAPNDSSRPTIQAANLNGYSVVRLDGVDDKLAKSFTLPQPVTCVCVAKTRWTFAAMSLFDGVNAASGLYRASGGQWDMYAGGTDLKTGSVDQSWHVHATYWSGASSELRVGGGAAATGNPGTAAWGGLTLGTWGGSTTQPNDGDYAEVLLWSRALSLTELNQVGNYLASKYALAWSTAT